MGAPDEDAVAIWKRAMTALLAICRPHLRWLKSDMKVFGQRLLCSVYQYRGDQEVVHAARGIEEALGCPSSTLFGIVDNMPETLSLLQARRIMRHVRQRMVLEEFRGGLCPAVILRFALDTLSVANGFGHDGLYQMLSLCLEHRSDPEVGRWACEIEDCYGFPLSEFDVAVPTWPVEKVQVYLRDALRLFESGPYREQRQAIDAEHQPGPAWTRKIYQLMLRTETALLRQHGLEASFRGLLVRDEVVRLHRCHPRVAPFFVSLSQQFNTSSLPIVASSASEKPTASQEDAIEVSTESSELAALNDLVLVKDRHIASLSAQLAHQGVETADVWGQLLVRDRKIQSLTAQITELSTALSRTQADVLGRDREIASLSAQIADHSDEIYQIQSQALATNELAADLTATMASQAKMLVDQWPDSSEELRKKSALLDRVRRHQEDMTKKDREMSLLREQLEWKEGEIARLAGEVHDQHGSCAVESMLAAEVETKTWWRNEALLMDSELAQLRSRMDEYCSIAMEAYKSLSIHEENILWDRDDGNHRQGILLRTSFGWSQIDARFRESAPGYQLTRVELVQNTNLECAFKSMLHLCQARGVALPSNLADQLNIDPAKQQVLSAVRRHTVVDGRGDLIWAWYGGEPRSVRDFVISGFASVPREDPGFFGSGHCCALEAGYACKRAASHPAIAADDSGERCIVLLMAALGVVYPLSWCECDFCMRDSADPEDCRYYGERLRNPVGTHVVPVQRRGCGRYMIAEGPAEYHQLVLDQDAQAFPFAVCWFR